MIYNLLEERWLPVLWADGKVSRIGIKEALTQSGRIRQIAASNPMDRLAILRFLLALLYWCKGNPPADADVTSGHSFPANWFSKLDDNKDCFNLLGGGKRFYQYTKEGDKYLTANYLIHEIPTGINWWHFRHSTDKEDGLCAACCALGILRLPLFSTSGGAGKPPGINAKPPTYVIPVGETLAQTLRLSWRPVSNLGTPAWEKPDMRLPDRGEVPLLTGLTWLPRRVWLGDPAEPDNACISCGRSEPLVRLSVFGPIGSTRTEESGPGRIWRDPHVLYAISAKGEVTSLHASNVLGSADAAAGQWGKIVGGILGSGPAGSGRSRVWVVGFSTVQNDKYLEATECTFAIPNLPAEGKDLVQVVGRWQKEYSALARKTRPPNEKGLSRKHVEIPPMFAAIRPHVEDRVSAKATELLAGSDEAWEQAAEEYRPMMALVAKSLSPGFTTAAVKWRRQIASVLPDMRQKAVQANRPAQKK